MIKGSVILKRGTWHIVLYYTDNNEKRKKRFINTYLPERGNKRNAQKLIDPEIKKLEKALKKMSLKNSINEKARSIRKRILPLQIF